MEIIKQVLKLLRHTSRSAKGNIQIRPQSNPNIDNHLVCGSSSSTGHDSSIPSPLHLAHSPRYVKCSAHEQWALHAVPEH